MRWYYRWQKHICCIEQTHSPFFLVRLFYSSFYYISPILILESYTAHNTSAASQRTCYCVREKQQFHFQIGEGDDGGSVRLGGGVYEFSLSVENNKALHHLTVLFDFFESPRWFSGLPQHLFWSWLAQWQIPQTTKEVLHFVFRTPHRPPPITHVDKHGTRVRTVTHPCLWTQAKKKIHSFTHKHTLTVLLM